MAKVLLGPATFVGGSLAGAFLLAAWLGAFDRDTEPAPQPPARAALAIAPPAVEALPTGRAPQAAPTAPAAAASSCPAQPLVTARAAHDGRFSLAAALSSGAQVEPPAFLAVAREAAQQGRVRDAEVALLAACHLTERSAGGHSVPLADLKSQMAQHYVALAGGDAARAEREGLLERASMLLSESAITYAAALGREASKTRMAEQRLASLRDPATLQLARSELAAVPPTHVLGGARQSAPAAEGADVDSDADAPSGCGGSAARRLICSDPELAQLERDLQRLHAQASSVSRDRSGLQQRDGQAVARRDAGCQDKACLLRWYAQRRSQLLGEF